jgi:Arc/MetJ family transcription regulator
MRPDRMRTTLNIDDQALEEAMAVTTNKTKTAVINEALREYVRRRRVKKLLTFRGKGTWEGDLDSLRKRQPRSR